MATSSAAQGNLAAVEIAKLEGQMTTGFATLGGKLDTLIAEQKAETQRREGDRETADARHVDHERRLRALEKFMWKSVGLGTVGGGGLGLLINWFLGSPS